MTDTFVPMHPGEVLDELYLKPLNMSAGKLAKQIHVPRTRIERLVKGTTPVTSDTALRLSRALGTTAQYWLNMQSAHDLSEGAKLIAEELKNIEPLAVA